MGIKVSLYATGSRLPRLAMAEHISQPGDADRARSAAEALFPGRIGESLGPVPMPAAYFPTDHVVRVGVFGDVVVANTPIGEYPAIPDAPVTVELGYHSVAGSFQLEYADPGAKRSLMYADGDTFDEAEAYSSGEPLPFEDGLWPVGLVDPDVGPPSTCTMIERALAWLFGAPGEGLPELEDDYLPEGQTMLHAFALAPVAPPTEPGPKPAPESRRPRHPTWPVYAAMATSLMLPALILALPFHSEGKYWAALFAFMVFPVAVIAYVVGIVVTAIRHHRSGRTPQPTGRRGS